MNSVIPHVIDQYVEEAALLWLRRDLTASAPHCRLSDLMSVDLRLDAHLDGLRIAEWDRPEAAWQACMQELAWNEPAEIFAAGILAWEHGRTDWMSEVLTAAAGSFERARPLAYSLAWIAEESARSQIDRLLRGNADFERLIGISAAAIRRTDPGKTLAVAIRSDDSALQARAYRAVGELARRDLLHDAQTALTASQSDVRFAAAWSVARLMESDRANDALMRIVEAQTKDSHRALQLVLRRLKPTDAALWLNQLAQDPGHLRTAVIGAGVVGVPDAIPWLLEIMQLPAVARVAAEAFTMITGLHMTAEKHDAPRPADFEAGPTDDPKDDNVEMDPDENLPWPNMGRLAEWWRKRHHEFEPGTRHLCGRPLTENWLGHVLRHGYQRQRAAAALELAILRPDQPMFNVRAPGYRQQESLGLR